MALNAKKKQAPKGNGPKQEAIEVGTYEGRVVEIIDLGLQKQRPYKGQEKPPKQMIRITYELCDEFCLDEDGNEMEDKPRWVSEEIPFSPMTADLAKSTKRYNAIDPDDVNDGDFTGLLGFPCMISVGVYINKAGEERNEVTDVVKIAKKKAAKLPELVNEARYFDVDEPDLAMFLTFMDWLQEKIKGNLEFKGSKLEALLNGEEYKEPVENGQDEDEPDEEPLEEANEPDEDEDEGDWLDEEEEGEGE